METIYLVKYYEDDDSITIFATNNINTAKKYVSKFNKILKKWKDYYSKYCDDRYGFSWIKEEYTYTHFRRWNKLNDIEKCYYEKIELR